MQKQEKKFSASHRSSFWIKLSFGIGHPPAIHQLQCICVGGGSRVPNLQMEFNYLDLFKSYGIFSDFVVPTWSSWFPCLSHCPHVIPIIPTSSPHHPHHPHIIPIAPIRSPCGPHGCGLCGLHPMLSPLSPSSPHHPRCPHVIPVISTSFPHHLEGPHIIPNPSHTHSTHPYLSGGGWGPQVSKNTIRFEIIKIF